MRDHKKVLYADDDLDDKAWVIEACKAARLMFDIFFVENGRQAIEYLSKAGAEERPSLIVLDLNMPELDGRQTLKRIKENELFKDIPVIIVTTSSSKVDMEYCKRMGAASYLIKPDTYVEWQGIVHQFTRYID